MRKHTPKHLEPQPHLEELLDQAVLAAGTKQAHRTTLELSLPAGAAGGMHHAQHVWQNEPFRRASCAGASKLIQVRFFNEGSVGKPWMMLSAAS
jgi:hypothetical protein